MYNDPTQSNFSPYQPSYPQQPTFQAPQPPPKKPSLWSRYRARSRTFQWGIGCGIVLFAFVACSLCSLIVKAAPPTNQTASGSTPTTTSQTAQPTNPPAHQPTTAPTPTQKPTQAAPTVKPTSPPVNGPALLGSNIGTFTAHYGQPNSHTDTSNGQYHYQTYPGENVDALIVATDIIDGGIYANRAYDITAAAPESGWSTSEASTKCAVFFPRDATYKREVVTQNGIDKIYFSSSLARLFPASAFTDASQNQVKAGYFDVLYLTRSNNVIDDCDIIIGEQQTQ